MMKSGEETSGSAVVIMKCACNLYDLFTPRVCMYSSFLRLPFKFTLTALRCECTIEVINTKLCSKADPAPGNNGYDGCLEFLIAQCTFFGRPMTVWDTHCFHHIDASGKYKFIKKASLLSLPASTLKYYMVSPCMFPHLKSGLSSR